MKSIPVQDAAATLNISPDELVILEKQGLIRSSFVDGVLGYFSKEIDEIKSRHNFTILDEAAQVETQIERDLVASANLTKKSFIVIAGGLSGYFLLLAVFTVLFMVNPLKTARLLGIATTRGDATIVTASGESRVLGAESSAVPNRDSLVQALFKPVAKVSLGVVRNISPSAYAQVSSVTIINPNDVLALDASGVIIPELPINLPASSYLQIGSNGLVVNLNSEYLQGRVPGTNPGNIAIVPEVSVAVPDLPDLGPIPVSEPTEPTEITNEDLINSTITIDTSGPLSGGGLVSLGGLLTISCPECVTESPLVAASTLTGATLAANVVSSSITQVGTLSSLVLGGAVTGTGALSFTSDTINSLTLDTGTTGDINIGTNANAKTINLGNVTGATALNFNSGTGGINIVLGPTTSSSNILIGNSASSTPDLLVLDNGTADPTGVNGGMYYDTSTGKFRCFENSAWANCVVTPSGGLQHSALYDTDEAMTNIPTGGAQVVLGTVSVTPTTTTGDVYVTGWADVYSSNLIDQPFNLVIETTSNCTGSIVGNAAVTYTITSAGSGANDRGSLRISGIALNPGTSAQPYSLCAAISSGAGDSDVLNWGMDALVID